MPRLFTNEASFNDLHVSGSTIMSASSGITTRIIGSGSTILAVSGSSGGILGVTDILNPSIFSVSSGSNTILDISAAAPNLFSVSSGSNTILAVDSTRQVLLNVSGSRTTGIKFIGIPQQTASFLLTYISESGVVGYSSGSNFTATNIQGGQTNYHTIWTSPTTISSSTVMYENNGEIGIGFPTESIGTYGRRLNISGSTYIESGSLQFSRFGKSQIILTNNLGQAGGVSTQNGLIAIGVNAANSLQSAGGSDLIAIGSAASNALTIGGSMTISIGRNAGNGITTGTRNIFIAAGDQTGIPTASSQTIHIVAGGGYELNDAASVLGSPNNIITNRYAFIGGGYQPAEYINDFYLGAGPFVRRPQDANLNIYSPSGTGSNIPGSNFTINAGRGTGTGSAGDIYFATSTTSSNGTTLQTLSNRMVVKGHTGNVGIGISSPDYKLQVTGSGILGSFNANNILYVNSSNVGINIANPTSRLQITGSTTETILNANNVLFVKGSNVGINNSDPQFNLHITGSVPTLKLNNTQDNFFVRLSSGGGPPVSQMFINGQGVGAELYGNAQSFVVNTGNVSASKASAGLIAINPDLVLGSSRTEQARVISYGDSLLKVNTSAATPAFDVKSDSTIRMGIWPVPAMYTSYRSTIPSQSLAVEVYSIPATTYNAAFFDYHLMSGSNMRAGQIMAGWSGSTVRYTEVTTADMGNTSYVTMSADISSNNFRLLGKSLLGDWTIKTIIRTI